MASKRQKLSLRAQVAVRLSGLANLTGVFSKSKQEYEKNMEAAKKSIHASNKPEVIEEINQTLEDTDSAIIDINKAFSAIEQELGNIRIFPQARQDVDRALSKAKFYLSESEKAFEAGLISREDLSIIEKNFNDIKEAAVSIGDSQLKLAQLSSESADDTDESRLDRQRQLNDVIQKNNVKLRDALAQVTQSAGVPSESIRLLNEIENQTLEEGLAASFSAQRDGIQDYFRAISLYFRGENEEAEKSILKAIATGKTLKFRAAKRKLEMDGSEGAFGKIEGILEQTAGKFGSVVGGFASMTRSVAVVISIAGSLFSFISMLAEAADKSRELKKSLLSGRSLGDLGLDLRASSDPSQVASTLTGLQDQFIETFQGGVVKAENTFQLTQEEALAKFNELANLHVGRLRNSFDAQKGMTKEINNLVEMGIVLNRRWAVSTSEIAQKNTELVNEFGYSEDALKSLYGSLERVSKNSYLSMPRLLGALQGLAEQSPVFGDTLKQTANFYARLYDTKILGTKEISSYIEKLTGIFQETNTNTIIVGQLLNTDKIDSFIDVLQRSIDAAPADTPAQRRRKQVLEDTLKEVQAIKAGSREGDAVTVQKIATGLGFVPASAKQALLGLSVLSSDTLNRQVSSQAELMDVLNPTVEELMRTGFLSGDPKLLLQMKDHVYAQAKSLLDAGKSVNLRQLFLDAIQRERQSEDKSTYDRMAEDLKKAAGSFVPPLRGVKNSLDGYLNRFYQLADSIIRLAQTALGLVAKIPGFGSSVTPSPETTDKYTTLFERIRQAEAKLETVPPDRREGAVRDLNTALRDMAALMKDKPEEVKVLMEGGPLILKNSFYLSRLKEGSLPESVVSNLGESKDAFNQWALGSVAQDKSRPTVNAVPLPDVPVSVILKEEAGRKKVKTKDDQGRSVEIKIPSGALLTEDERKRLWALSQNPSDPRAVLLSALHLKYQGNPIFAYVLKSFAENMSSTNDYETLKKKVMDDITTHKSKIEGEFQKTNRGQGDAYKRILSSVFVDIERVSNELSRMRPASVSTAVSPPIIFPTPAPPPAASGSAAPTALPRAVPSGPQAAAVGTGGTGRVPVSSSIGIHAKSIKIRLFTAKVDVGALARKAVSDAIAAYTQR